MCGHVSPDGDCLGSQLALAHALRAKGKRAVCLLAHDDAVDKSFLFLPGANELIPACEFESDVDAFIAVDVPNLERLGDAARVHESAGAHFTLDHHAVESCMAEYNYVDPDAPATGMLVWRLIGEMGVERTFEMAQCCYLALMTDTGAFSSRTPLLKRLRLRAKWCRLARGPKNARKRFISAAAASLGLEGVMLSNMQVAPSGEWALSMRVLTISSVWAR